MPALVWLLFLAFIVAMVLLDLGVFQRNAHVISVREALSWTAVWVALALAFNVVVYFLYSRVDGASVGREAAIQFLTGYLTEKSLSIDNIFVIALIFTYFRVPLQEQRRLLVWGVLGAIILRGIMIGAGTVLLNKFEWIIYVFGVFLLVSAAKMLKASTESIDPERNLLVRLVRRYYPVTTTFDGSRFFTEVNGRRAATPLTLALVLVETSDVMFAVDSIPAIFAITRDPFLIWTSNVLAILGLRSLFFALSGLMSRFRYVTTSLVFLLAFIGVKMLVSHHYPIPNTVSLAIIAGILSVGILASVLSQQREKNRTPDSSER